MPAGPVLNIARSLFKRFQVQESCLHCSWATKPSATACSMAIYCGTLLCFVWQEAERGHGA